MHPCADAGPEVPIEIPSAAATAATIASTPLIIQRSRRESPRRSWSTSAWPGGRIITSEAEPTPGERLGRDRRRSDVELDHGVRVEPDVAVVPGEALPIDVGHHRAGGSRDLGGAERLM